MKGFFKFLLFAVVHTIATFIVGSVVTGIIYLLSQIGIGRALLSIINDGYVTELIAPISQGVAYVVCVLIADKLRGYKPFRALCIVNALLQLYGIVSSIIWDEAFIQYILALIVSIIFFFRARDNDK